MKFAQIESYAVSDIGLSRPNNEDFIICLPQEAFFSIADGMGGHNAGEIAAKEASIHLKNFFINKIKNDNYSLLPHEIKDHLNSSIIETNKKIFSISNNKSECKGMGTTLTCIYFNKDSYYFAHVGDSRIYKFQSDKLFKITNDHSLASQMIRNNTKKIPPSYHSVLTKAIGTTANITPDIGFSRIKPSDIFLICSDGFSDYVSENEMLIHLSDLSDAEQAVKKLIQLAKQNGSFDNISLILIKIKELL